MAEVGMNDLMIAIKEMAIDLKEVKADVAELKVTTKRLDEEQSSMREEMKLNFKKLDRKLTILTKEILEAKTDISLLEDKVY